MPLLLALLLAQSLFQELSSRHVGPFRGGRTKAATGVVGRPGVYYLGAVNGGVFKTDDYGRTWTPIFDDQPTGSIGAIAVAPSNPEVVYVGSGEGMHRPDLSVGDGIYRSGDGGKTWKHLGLRDGQQIPQIAVDPRDPNRLFVAVLGHPYGPNEERGIFRSTDGGETFQRVLYRDADTGGVEVVLDPADPRIVYAALWEAREGPWENGEFFGPGSGLFKSTDGGDTWRRLEKGLPKEGLRRIGLGIAPSRPSRIFASVSARNGQGGLYRSDDAGESWAKITDDERIAERGDDMAEVKVHPRNPDVVFNAAVVAWKSIDGGKTWSAFRGAPGGDDYQRFWIDPQNPETMLLASDQGAVVTVNGGATWTSWYNQPTAQMFHVTADNAFPYRLCGGQQESGSACVPSRGEDGSISFRDWHPGGFEEYGYAAPHPRDPDIVYGGRISRWDRRNGQVQDVTPRAFRSKDFRMVRTQPMLFAPTDPYTLYFASNVVWKTRDGGKSWTQISPDLTRKAWAVPPNLGKYAQEAKVEQRGVVYALAASPLDGRVLWAGTDDGLVHVTRDGGKSWKDVTPGELQPWAKISILDAGHFDAGTAYAAVNTLRLDELHPRIFRTHDYGATWTQVTSGLPEGTVVNVVREDPRRKGLLYCGTELAVHVSFDDGGSWQPLRLNMPATSIRDLIVKDDDLAVATHGRGFWILDDVEPLRQIDDGVAGKPLALLRPAPAVRARFANYSDTPLPPDEPAAKNPPEGAAIDYLLGNDAAVTLEILDPAGKLVRRFSSEDKVEPPLDEGNVPRWWIRPGRAPSGRKGLHRFYWDLHHPPPAAADHTYPISGIPGDTPREPRGPWVLPGRYTVRLTAAGETQTQTLTVKPDPRLKTTAATLREQLALSLELASALTENTQVLAAVKAARGQRPELEAGLRDLLRPEEPRRSRLDEAPTLDGWNERLATLYQTVQGADVPPTVQLRQAIRETLRENALLVAKARAALSPSPGSPQR